MKPLNECSGHELTIIHEEAIDRLLRLKRRFPNPPPKLQQMSDARIRCANAVLEEMKRRKAQKVLENSHEDRKSEIAVFT